ncbi:DUF7173 family protein [Pseudoxanthomonas sacheonensis]|uniref:DUF7173 family protein n=1 Tax=Pseudoxanthomonas sacheonensis TaxID=443615 RepID=UPI0013D548F6|nr:hypothetical protein [Pseudoxanthomonas sacheonensis]KAF1706253.1 hypothetical protein CSC73_16230 [Pseudoxanthomonas sacheonensis]
MNQIDEAAERVIGLKLQENQAKAARIEAEQALIKLVGCKAEGSSTHKGERYKVMTTGTMYRKVDEAALAAVRSALSPTMFEQVFRYKPEVITAGIRYLQQNEPELYAIAAQAITATPGKPAVEVSVLAVEVREAA